MTKAEQARVVAWRLKILRYSQGEPRQVARTCRHFGISRTLFYRWKRRFETYGEAGLADARHLNRRVARNHRSKAGMPFLVGVTLALSIGLLMSFFGLDRDRAFYPTVMIVIALYYAFFTVVGGSIEALAFEAIPIAVFVVASIAGFKYSLWLVVIALVAHGVFVISLIYLSIQIRGQTVETELATGKELSNQLNYVYANLSDNAELAYLFYLGINDFHSLSPGGKSQLSTYFSRLGSRFNRIPAKADVGIPAQYDLITRCPRSSTRPARRCHSGQSASIVG